MWTEGSKNQDIIEGLTRLLDEDPDSPPAIRDAVRDVQRALERHRELLEKTGPEYLMSWARMVARTGWPRDETEQLRLYEAFASQLSARELVLGMQGDTKRLQAYTRERERVREESLALISEIGMIGARLLLGLLVVV